LDITVAKSLINLAKRPFPDTDAGCLELADKIVRDAQEAWDQGIKGEPVRSIMSIHGATLMASSARPDVDIQRTTWKNPAVVTQAPSEPSVAPVEGKTKGTQGLIAGLREAGIPAIAPPTGEGTPFPQDLAKMGDTMLRSLASEYTHFLSYTQWRLGVEEADAIVSERMVEKARRSAILSIDRVDPETKKTKLAAHLDAEVGSSPEVLTWEDRLAIHEAGIKLLRAERDIYQGYLDRISREMTARHNEYERSIT